MPRKKRNSKKEGIWDRKRKVRIDKMTVRQEYAGLKKNIIALGKHGTNREQKHQPRKVNMLTGNI